MHVTACRTRGTSAWINAIATQENKVSSNIFRLIMARWLRLPLLYERKGIGNFLKKGMKGPSFLEIFDLIRMVDDAQISWNLLYYCNNYGKICIGYGQLHHWIQSISQKTLMLKLSGQLGHHWQTCDRRPTDFNLSQFTQPRRIRNACFSHPSPSCFPFLFQC